MPAAADTLAVGVEEHHLDAGKPPGVERFGDFQLEPLDEVARRELADETPRVGIAELEADPPLARDVVTEMAAAQRFGEDAHTAFEPLAGLEQGADLDVLGQAEGPGEPERGEQRVAGLGLGDEEADRA